MKFAWAFACVVVLVSMLTAAAGQACRTDKVCNCDTQRNTDYHPVVTIRENCKFDNPCLAQCNGYTRYTRTYEETKPGK